MRKSIWLSALTMTLIFVASIALAVNTLEQKYLKEITDTKEQLLSLQKDYDTLQQEYFTLQQNYTDQQNQFMDIFTPSLETQLGAKVLVDNKTGVNYGKNYLWVTGEVYNRGYGIAYNTVLQVKLFSQNSSFPSVVSYIIGDIDVNNFEQVRYPFYSDGEIERWEINVTCSLIK
jgi:hypothetical protein